MSGRSFREVKEQINSRSSKGIELCKKYDLNIRDFQFITAHKFFDNRHQSHNKYYRGSLCDTDPFKETLRRFEKSRDKEVTNIQQFEKYYQISYIDLEKLNSRIDEIRSQKQQIEVKQ